MINKLSSKREIEFRIKYLSLVGYRLKVINSSNKNYIGIEGIIIFESENSFIILDEKGQKKRILKKNLIIEINIENKIYEIDVEKVLKGTLIYRIKKLKL